MVKRWKNSIPASTCKSLNEIDKPQLGARFLTAQFQSGAANRLLPGPLRIVIDSYLRALNQCDELAIGAIDSMALAELISRSDTRDAVAPVCDLMISRKSDWEIAFEANPLDSRGATWVFASRWALATLALDKEAAQNSMTTIRDVAIAPSHPLNLPAAYAFKYVGLNRPEWLSADLLEPLCKSWTYSRLVVTSLLQQLALKGVDPTSLVIWDEFWNPPWQYNRNEIDLLAAALKWRGFASPIEPRIQTTRLMDSLAQQLKTMLAQPSCMKTTFLETPLHRLEMETDPGFIARTRFMQGSETRVEVQLPTYMYHFTERRLLAWVITATGR